jgi:hypothetical protein
MRKREIRKLARAKAQEGMDRQQIFTELQQEVKARPDELADVVRYVIPLAVRKQHKVAQGMLIGLLAFSVAVKVMLVIGLFTADVEEVGRFPWLLLLPVLNIWLLYGVVTHRGENYRMVALFSVISLTQLLRGIDGPLVWVDLLFAVSLLALGWYLDRKLTPAYLEKKEKYLSADGQPRLRKLISFE